MLNSTRNVFRLCLRHAREQSNKRQKGEVVIPKGKYLTEPWNERKGMWKSSFRFFEPKTDLFGPDLIRLLQTPIDLSPANVKKWYERRMEEQEAFSQGFIEERYRILGGDLAAAHFVVHRGGAIRFYNESEWVRKKPDGSYLLPAHNVPGLYLEAIDCSGIQLRTTGLENVLYLSKLRWLSLADNPLIDDWSLDAVSGSYGDTLQHLDVSNCPRVTYRGLSCFYRFDKLDTLLVSGISESSEFKLACMMLEDINPKLNIKGIEFSKVSENKLNAPA